MTTGAGGAAPRIVVEPGRYGLEQLPAGMRELLPDDFLARWTDICSHYWAAAYTTAGGNPDGSAHSGSDSDGPDSAGAAIALVTGRHHTAYRKLTRLVGDPAAWPALVRCVVAEARRDGLVAVKWECEVGATDPAAVRAAATTAGFAPVTPPIPSGPGTDGDGGAILWLVDSTGLREPRYYRQTTDFTCGACSALMAAPNGFEPGGSRSVREANHALEMMLWRGATNFPACEPVGLGVQVARARPLGDPPEVYLSTREPVMADLGGAEAAGLRALLQRESRREAATLGIPVHDDILTADHLVDLIRAGRPVLLLIDLELMHGAPAMHWVLCHAVVGNAVVIEDPWLEADHGETAADGHLLPVPPDELARMSWIEPLGETPYRGAVVLPAPADNRTT